MTYPASITLDPQPLRDWRVIPVHHMRRLTLALGELNRLCPDLPDAHPLHAIAGEIRLVVRDAWLSVTPGGPTRSSSRTPAHALQPAPRVVAPGE